MIRLVVFDLDGTLVDSRRDLARATNQLIHELGGSPVPEETVARMVGDGARALVERALTAAGLAHDSDAALARFLALYDERLLDTTTVYPGMRDALASLAGNVSLAVLTNKPTRATASILEGLALAGFFDHVIGGDTTLGRKPDPAGLLDLVSRAASAPESTLLVGDSAVDLQTARRAGTRICLARYGFGFRFVGSEFDGSERFIDAPSELAALVLHGGDGDTP